MSMASDKNISEENIVKIRGRRNLSFQDLYSIDQVSLDDLALIFDVAKEFKKIKTEKLSLNKGCSLVHAFFEPSTRTLASFDLSAKNLSMDTSSVSGGGSVKKGESFIDTAETLDAYNLKVITVRSSQAGIAEMLSKHVKASVINAGDGWHEHPTQALLDGMTMLEHFGGKNLKGKTITIIGDILHSRVFGSLVRLLKKLKAEIRVAAPITFLPYGVENFGLKTYSKIEEAA